MVTYKELYPVWDPDDFEMPGMGIVDEQTCVSALKASRAACRPQGGSCPCCGQHVQIYRRSIYKKMAKCLIWLVAQYHRLGGDWVSLKDGPIFRGGDNAKLSYWHLIFRHEEHQDLYMPTQISTAFVAGEKRLPKYAYVYNGKVQGFSKKKIFISECFDGDFDVGTIGLGAEDLGVAPWAVYGGGEDDE